MWEEEEVIEKGFRGELDEGRNNNRGAVYNPNSSYKGI